jgi:hypothetical protein
MVKISITSSDVRNMKGIGKTSLKPYDLNFQTAYVHTCDKSGNANPYPEKVEMMLEKDPANGAVMSYTVGDYELAPASIYVDRQGNLSLRPLLHKFKALHKAA